MNISARAVVEKMEEELLQLAGQLDSRDTAAVKEHARVLKAYCDLLLATEKEAGDKPTQQALDKVAPVSVPESSSTSAVPKREIPSTGGNLLEF
ncbi:DUF5327 family protein [Bacillus piscicola]|uniref:DUF5327 family protein n=1 Tax=Bacillus piscicola TaxID=1632684 RepID=UPI001F09FE7A|nr:DUF5327 family protein [Bacillus piscicola]